MIEQFESSLDDDLDVTVEHRGPEVGSMLQRVETLLSEGSARIAADRQARRRVVESLVRTISVHDGDHGAIGNTCSSQGDHSDEDGYPQHLSPLSMMMPDHCA